MATSIMTGDYHFTGNVAVAGTTALANGTVTNAMLVASAGIDVSKLDHRFVQVYQQPDEKDVTHGRAFLHIAQAAGTVSKVQISLGSTIPTGSAKVTVAVKRSTAGGAWTDVITEHTLDSSSVARTVETAVVSSAAYVAGDLFEVWVQTVYNGTDTVPQGLVVAVTFDEEAQ